LSDAKPLVVVAAGGTGGHLFPAQALSAALVRRGFAVDLATDARATRYGDDFPARETHIIPSATFRGRDPVAVARTLAELGRGTATAVRLFGRLRPAAVVGFGGYPTIPPVAAAVLRGIPSIIHEQNGVMGRANRLLAPMVRAIATSFPGVLERDPRLAAKATRTGNPVREAVTAAAEVSYTAPSDSFRLLVFGGSQGARIMADVVPAAVALLARDLRARLMIVQQARDEDIGRVEAAYAQIGVQASVAPFFPGLPARMAASHLVISRSGASTVAELAAIGRPAILVPLPHALDHDQRANAKALEAAGGAIRIEQDDFTPQRLGQEIAVLADAPQRLSAMSAAARACGALDAADRLADLVERVAGLSAQA
jgi:UDP-N-acetylglucosamine--N-acetylmuramyl-(pentapeptide) pyrophosphoryl-undecaprenol N-acetylglucosamine transferase